MPRKKKEAPGREPLKNALTDKSIAHDTVDWTLVKRARESSTAFNPFDEQLSRVARWTLPASRLDISEKFFEDVAA